MNCKLTYNKNQIKLLNPGVKSVATILSNAYNGTSSDLKICPEIVIDSCFVYQAQATNK